MMYARYNDGDNKHASAIAALRRGFFPEEKSVAPAATTKATKPPPLPAAKTTQDNPKPVSVPVASGVQFLTISKFAWSQVCVIRVVGSVSAVA